MFLTSTFRLQERQLEPAQGNQVTVRMLFAPINPADLNMISGSYPIQSNLPAVGGNEGLGRVVAVGDRVSSLKVGDLVIPGSPSLGKWKLCATSNTISPPKRNLENTFEH